MRRDGQRQGRAVYREFPGRRWLNVALRAAHIAGVTGFAAAVASGNPSQAFTALLFLSGALMLLLDLWSSPGMMREVAGLGVLLKLALLAALLFEGMPLEPVFWGVLLLSVFFAHAPAGVRHRQVIPQRAGGTGRK